MPINIPTFQPLRFIDVPDTGQELARLMQGANNLMRTYASIEAAKQRAARAAAASQAKALGREEMLSNGQRIRVQGSDSKERAVSRARELNRLAVDALNNDEAFRTAFDSMGNASVEKQGEILADLEKNVVPNIAKGQAVEVQEAIASIMKKAREGLNKRTGEVESAAGDAFGDVLGARFGQYAENLRSLFTDNTAEDKRISGERRDKIMRDAIENNAYLRNQQLREAEGAGLFDRAFNGTGSPWTNLTTTAAEMLPDFAADIAPAASLGATGGLIAGPPGAIAGALLGTGVSMLLGGAEERGQYLSNVATDSRLSEEQRAEALSGPESTGAFAVGAGLSALPGGIMGRGADMARSVMRRAGNTAAEGAASAAASNATRRGIRHMLTRDVPEMAAEGGLQTGAEQVAQNMLLESGSGVDIDPFENLGEAVAAGALAGGALGVPRNLARRNRQQATPSPDTAPTEPIEPDATAKPASDTTPPTPPAGGAFAAAQQASTGRRSEAAAVSDFWQGVKRMFKDNPDSITRDTVLGMYTQEGFDPATFDAAAENAYNLKSKRRISKNLFNKIRSTDATAAATTEPTAQATTPVERSATKATQVETAEPTAQATTPAEGAATKATQVAETARAVAEPVQPAAPEAATAQSEPATKAATAQSEPAPAVEPDAVSTLNKELIGKIRGVPRGTSTLPEDYKEYVREYLRNGGTEEDLEALFSATPVVHRNSKSPSSIYQFQQDIFRQAIDEVKAENERVRQNLITTAALATPEQIAQLNAQAVNQYIGFLRSIEEGGILSQHRREAATLRNIFETEKQKRDNYAAGQTGGQPSRTRNEAPAVGQPETQRAAGTAQANPATDSRVATDTGAGATVATGRGAATPSGNNRAAQGARSRRSAVQSVGPNQSVEGNAEPQRTGGSPATPDSGRDNRQPAAGGAEQNPSTGSGSNKGVRDSSHAGDAAEARVSNDPNNESGVVPVAEKSSAPAALKTVDDVVQVFHRPPEAEAAPEGYDWAARFTGPLSDAEAKTMPVVLSKYLGKGTLSENIGKLNELLVREAIWRDKLLSNYPFTRRDRTKLEKLREAKVSKAAALPRIPQEVIDEVSKAREANVAVTPEGVVMAKTTGTESIAKSTLNMLCRR